MKVHIASSENPILGGDVMVLCGKVIPRAEKVPLSEVEQEPRSLGGLCMPCALAAICQELHYEAGIVPGQQLRDGKEQAE